MQTARLCLALVALTACLAGCALRGDEFETRPFDPTLWRENREARGEMVDDLLRHDVELGLRRVRSIRLLGLPDISGEQVAKDGQAGTYDVYFVGRYKDQPADYLTLFYVRGRLQEIERPIGVPIDSFPP